MAVNPVPAGYHTITPYLIVDDCDRMITFLKKGLDAQETTPPHRNEDGSVVHAELKIGNSMLMMSQATEFFPAMPCMIHLYVKDCDTLYKKALAAGGTSIREPEDQFYGDRSGGVEDPCGNQWWISTHIEDVSEEEMQRRIKESGK